MHVILKINTGGFRPTFTIYTVVKGKRIEKRPNIC